LHGVLNVGKLFIRLKKSSIYTRATYHFNCIRERSEKIIMPELNEISEVSTDRQSRKKPKDLVEQGVCFTNGDVAG
jgi:hypothetical protein